MASECEENHLGAVVDTSPFTNSNFLIWFIGDCSSEESRFYLNIPDNQEAFYNHQL
jgi:hypothetical protein